MVHPIRTQVVIVGGGPVGMLLAAELAGYGVDTVVLERQAATSQRPKATTLHARTVQTLARRGYLPPPPPTPDNSTTNGTSSGSGTGSGPGSGTGTGPGTGSGSGTGSGTETEAGAGAGTETEAGAWAGAGGAGAGATVSSPFHFAGLPGLHITAPATEPGPLLKRPQAELEELFEHRARTRGAHIMREHHMTEIHQHPGHVTALAHGPHGPAHYEAAYLIGADGARGTVRHQAHIPSDTHDPTLTAMMGLVHLPDPTHLPTGWHRTPRGWVIAKHTPDGTHLRTVHFTHNPTDRTRPLTLDELTHETSHIIGHDITMTTPRWLSRFSDYTRLAHTYRNKRILLAGDAAHLHFPIGGQGLSTGLLDALNLAWKLAATLHHTAAPTLLDTYHTERHPAAQRVINNVRAQITLMHPHPQLDPLRNLITQLLPHHHAGAHLAAMISAQDTTHPTPTPHPPHPTPHQGTFLPNTTLTTPTGPTTIINLLHPGHTLLLLLLHPHTSTGTGTGTRTSSSTGTRTSSSAGSGTENSADPNDDTGTNPAAGNDRNSGRNGAGPNSGAGPSPAAGNGSSTATGTGTGSGSCGASEEQQHYEKTARRWTPTLRIIHAEPHPDIPTTALLLRPDGYIAWTPHNGPLENTLTQYLTPTNPPPTPNETTQTDNTPSR